MNLFQVSIHQIVSLWQWQWPILASRKFSMQSIQIGKILRLL